MFWKADGCDGVDCGCRGWGGLGRGIVICSGCGAVILALVVYSLLIQSERLSVIAGLRTILSDGCSRGMELRGCPIVMLGNGALMYCF